MRKAVIGLALASTAIASPALAREDAWYIGVDGGAMLVEDSDVDVNGVDDQATFDWDYGYDFDVVAGYDFGGFRLETEAAYKGAGDDGITLFGETYEDSEVNHEFNTLSFMVNGMIDFGDDDGLQGFIGGGAGVARSEFEEPVLIDDSDTGFAWQAIAGIRAPLTDNWDVGLKYRFFNHKNIELVTPDGNALETDIRSHSLLGSLTYNFWSPAPPPPPPPPPQVVCNTGPYIVFFDWDSSEITPEAASILDSAIASYADCNSVPIMVAGYTDTSGTASYNIGLSERRAQSVESYLEARNIPGSAISTEGFGEQNPRVPTADGVRELQNRRVEITYGPGSGM